MAIGSNVGCRPAHVIDLLVRAANAHDLEALVACFADDYVNETPVHPPRGFRGVEQVRKNWSTIFAAVPDVRADVLRRAVNAGTAWTEWELAGTRRDGTAFLMRGVVIFGVAEDRITSARFYLEPVDETTGDVDAAVGRLTGAVPENAKEA